MKRKKSFSLLIYLVILFSLTTVPVFALEGRIGLTQDFESLINKNARVIFGKQYHTRNETASYYMIGYNGEAGVASEPGRITLFHTVPTGESTFYAASDNYSKNIFYKDSLVHQALEKLYPKYLSEKERNFVAKKDFPNQNLSQVAFWPLSAEEVNQLPEQTKKDHTYDPNKPNTIKDHICWLRDDRHNGNEKFLTPDGTIVSNGRVGPFRHRPAFSMDVEKILFLSLTGNSYEEKDTFSFSKNVSADMSQTQYKLTLRDDSRDNFKVNAYRFQPHDTDKDSLKLIIDYAGSNVGAKECLSLISKPSESSREILAYGNFESSHNLQEQGTASIVIKKNYITDFQDSPVFYVFQEERNDQDNRYVDYSSDLIPISTQFKLIEELNNLRLDDPPQHFDILKELKLVLSPIAPTFKLPKRIEILVNDHTLPADDFSYNTVTGEIIISSDNVLGNITIRAAADRKTGEFHIEPNEVNFPKIMAGYTSAPQSEIKVSNTGDLDLSLNISLEGTHANSFTLSEQNINIRPKQETSFLIAAKEKLASGDYTAEIKLEDPLIPDLTAKIPIRLHVADAPPTPPAPRPTPKTYRILLSSSKVDFGDQSTDYQSETLKKSIHVRNEGTGNIYLQEVLSNKASSDFEIDFSPSSLYPGDSTEISLRPKEGLPAGIYEENFTLKTNRSSADKQFIVRLTVKENKYVEWEEKVDVPLDKVWTIRLNRELDAKSLSSENISIMDEKNLPLPIKLSLGENLRTILVYPEKDFDPNSTYQLSIRALLSADGKVLKDNIRMKFTTVNPL
ncbi:MAG: choice-of-anchor D domain-containing protein [Peptostreptococcaceae bacterium]|nr:choice-of-anchor D domain-containing protein [Peptostreptococcaceae bacterium]